MIDYSDKIEKFLRGQMSQHEENDFKNELRTNAEKRSQVCSLVLLIKLCRFRT